MNISDIDYVVTEHIRIPTFSFPSNFPTSYVV
jgi:hypothetical protein